MKGVVFDFGGVMMTVEAAFIERMAQYGLGRDEVLPFFMGPDAIEARMSGRKFAIVDMIPMAEELLASRLGTDARAAAEAIFSLYVDSDMMAWNESMVELATELHDSGVKIGLLANGPSDLEAAGFQRLVGTVADASVLSGRDGVGKPSKQAFDLMADRLGLALDECFFIDDNEHNIVGARALGMPSFLYEGDVGAFATALRERRLL